MGRSVSILIAGESGDVAAELVRLGFGVDTIAPDALTRAALGGVDALLSFGPVPEDASGTVLHLAVGDHGPADARLRAPAHAVQIAARLRAMIRLSVLEDVARLRSVDAADAGSPPIAPAPPAERSCVLFVGAPCPAFMRLQHAMAGAKIDTVAAFSTFNAFDYLHERAFDAVVLNADPKPDLAHTVCSAMRRNTRLYHTPAILLTRGESYAHADEAFARGASDLLDADAPAAEMRERITALTGERRRRRAAKALLEACRAAPLLDQNSDLFGAEFGERHLKSLAASASVRKQTLAIIGLQASAPQDAGEKQALSALDQFSAMLRHCVRAEDLAVRAENGSYYVALPNTTEEEARLVAARVSAIAECTAYEGRDPHRPFRLSLMTRVFEADPSWNGTEVARAALAPFGPRAVAAYA
ncbi:MAG: hypothetical protein ACOC0V_00720 [Oceanicaulis sp.]